MRKILILIIVVFTAFGRLGAQSLVGAEYYFDSDPGVGNGTPLSITTGDSIDETHPIDMSGLGVGFHNIFVRVRDDLGRWSLVRRHLFYIYDETYTDLSVTQPDLTGFEYFFDMDMGVGTGTWVPSAAGSTLTEAVDFSTDGLGAGFHQLFVRARDASGRWGQYTRHLFYVFDDTYMDLTELRSKIVAAEYYFDKDTVQRGQGIPLNITEGNEVEWSGGIPVEGLEAGDHTLFIRVQDSVGMWSIVGAKQFSVVGLTSITNSPICQGSADGEATVRIIGGKAPYTFLWDDPEQQSDSTATGLKAGEYTVTVTDAEGAIIRETVEITEYDTIKIDIETSDTDCKKAQGSAKADASGDNPPFKYLWTIDSEHADEQFISGLRSGFYEVTVADAKGCQNKAVATINDIGGPVIDVKDRVQHLICAGDADGIIDPIVTGGSGSLTYLWSNGATSKTIVDLKAGTYDLTVIDDSACIATASVAVLEPPPLTFSSTVTDADCGSQNGAVTINASGGNGQYFYYWDGESFPATRTGLGAGVYEVTVIDREGCSGITQAVVNEKGAPTVNVTAVNQASCGANDGSVLIAVGGGTGKYTFDWKDETGATIWTDEDLINVGPGIYSVSVSDGSGCNAYATATIQAELPPTEPICLVTVDSTGTKNVIVWSKIHGGNGIDGYIVYRETTSSGVYDSIAYIPYDSLSMYTDESADPEVKSWRYRLATVNECGVKSRLSEPHKTMHLTINLGLAGRINLIWSPYQGFEPKDGNYKIYRYTPGIGLDMIDTQVSSDDPIVQFVDTNPPDGDIWYYVVAEHPTGCTLLKASTLNSSRSNRKYKLKVVSARPFMDLYNLVVYPNPSTGTFKLALDMEGTEDLDVRVFDLSGKIIYRDEIRNPGGRLEHTIDLSGYEKGIYQLNLRTDRGIYNKVLVIQ